MPRGIAGARAGWYQRRVGGSSNRPPSSAHHRSRKTIVAGASADIRIAALSTIDALPETARTELLHVATVLSRGEAAQETAAPSQAPAGDANRYVDTDALVALLEEGDIVLSWASYFLELAAEESSQFKRRQDVPERAQLTSTDVRRLAGEIKAWRRLLAKEAAAKPFLRLAMRFPPFVIVS